MNHRRNSLTESALRTYVLRTVSFRAALVWCFALVLSAQMAMAAPFAAFVMDARNGEVLHSQNADTKLHPASLTKMMTLYIAFQAIEKGDISLDTLVTVSANAAGQQPSRLGLRRGQKIQLRYLLRAAAIKSANDAATAIGEAISGSEPAFAELMTRTARAMGMKNTTFKNANGLTAAGHVSTARDMSILGRHVLYDFPQYYNLFSRRSADAGIGTVRTTNSRFLDSYEGADGIKTGYTTAAGFNLTASARRGNQRIIATVFGGTSTAQRNATVSELLDLGFRKSSGAQIAVRRPAAPPYGGGGRPRVDAAPDMVAGAAVGGGIGDTPGGAAKTIRVTGAVQRSPRPNWRTEGSAPAVDVARTAAPPDEVLAAIQQGVDAALDDVAKGVMPAGHAPLLTAAAPPRPDRVAEAPPPGTLEAAALAVDAGLGEEAQLGVGAVTAVAAVVPGSADPLTAETTKIEPDPMETARDLALAGVAPPGIRPPARPVRLAAAPAAAPAEVPAAEAAVALAEAAPAEAAPVAVAAAAPAPQPRPEAPAVQVAAVGTFVPPALAETDLELTQEAESDGPAAAPAPILLAEPRPEPKSPRGTAPQDEALLMAAVTPEIFADSPAEPKVVTRLSTSGGRQWGVNVGLFPSEYEAERVLLTTALKESATLGGALRKVGRSPRGFQANFVGMTEDMAVLACSRLQARNVPCSTLSPG